MILRALYDMWSRYSHPCAMEWSMKSSQLGHLEEVCSATWVSNQHTFRFECRCSNDSSIHFPEATDQYISPAIISFDNTHYSTRKRRKKKKTTNLDNCQQNHPTDLTVIVRQHPLHIPAHHYLHPHHTRSADKKYLVLSLVTGTSNNIS